MPELQDEFAADETPVTPVSEGPRSSKVDFLEVRLDGMKLEMTEMRTEMQMVKTTSEASVAYGVVILATMQSMYADFLATKADTGEKVSGLRTEVRTMENRVSDAGVKAAKETIKDYELGQAKEKLARDYENATHWKRFWAEKGVGIALGAIGFLVLSFISLIVWIYVRGFR